MKHIFEKVWELALPYQDKRDDRGHAEVTFNYAKRLAKLEEGNKEIILPAIILHDIGWSQLPKEKRFVIFNENATKEEKLAVRYKHQDEGVMIAKKILKKVNYPLTSSHEILEIISQHDTRNGFISKSEGLVRNADKLWRFSKTGFKADVMRNGFTSEFIYEGLKKQIKLPNFLYPGIAKQIAYQELELRKEEFSNTRNLNK
ncbi:HD domain-containing protein [Candidatus Pacearchaeota archaeon]|nr:HD domain-containing protein [Candidatus Pacearchaeota archaeon]